MSWSKTIEEIKNKVGAKKVTLRFAPSPNGRATVGHLKGIILLDNLKKRLNALGSDSELKLRYDDTNFSENYLKENYESFLDLIKSYKVELSEVYYSSSNANYHFKQVESLLEKKNAFICSCKCISDVKTKKTCTCRLDTTLQSLSLKEAINKDLVVKYNSKLQQPFVIYRKVESGEEAKYSCTFALQGPLDDYKMGVNVIVRGKDLESVTKRQKEIYETHFKKEYPLVLYWGRVSLWNSKTNKNYKISKSEATLDQDYPSLEYFNKNGYTEEAIRNWIEDYGITKNDIKLDLVKLDFFQKKSLNKIKIIDLERASQTDFFKKIEATNFEENNLYFKSNYSLRSNILGATRQVYSYKNKTLYQYY